MNLVEAINDALVSYKKEDIDLRQARDIILMHVDVVIRNLKDKRGENGN